MHCGRMSAMRRLALIICAVTALLFAFATGSALAVDRTISGTVSEQGATTFTPLENVCVAALTLGGAGAREEADRATTDSAGHFSLTAPAGSYKLSFDDCGTDAGDYITEWYSNKFSYDSADVLDTSSSNKTVDAALAHGGS